MPMEYHKAMMLGCAKCSLLLLVSLRTCSSFTITHPISTLNKMHISQGKRPNHHRIIRQLNRDENFSEIKSDYDNSDISHDEQRRKVLKTFLASTTAIASIIAGDSKQEAMAEDANLLDTDQQKVVLQVSSSNVPDKYGSSNNDNSFKRRSEDDWMTEVEARRINIFEKAAPSVVYIDTYIESRDAFSTNV